MFNVTFCYTNLGVDQANQTIRLKLDFKDGYKS